MRYVSLCLLVAASACVDIPNEAKPAVVYPVFDPAQANLPTPNDLALNAKGLVEIAPRDELSAAENELHAALSGYDGFSTGSAPRVQFSDAISAASLTDQTVLAFDLGERNKPPSATPFAVTRTYDDC